MNVRPDFKQPVRRCRTDPEPPAEPSAGGLAWIRRCAEAPYFETEDGRGWTPIGHNEAVDWVSLAGLFRRRDVSGVDRHLGMLAARGVTCLRLMLEYCQHRHRFFERPDGTPVPAMVAFWDDLFALCERHGLRVLLTPFDTFWMARRWRHHPYSTARGGPLRVFGDLLGEGEARRRIKARLDFVVRRWGGSGAFFAWDLMNEIHPDLDARRADRLHAFVGDASRHIRTIERSIHGRSHLQTASVFAPHLLEAHGDVLTDLAFRHPDLDFASPHFYRAGSIDAPRDTIAPAVAVGQLLDEAIGAITDGRPILDSESGPIHSFNDQRHALPVSFDEEYFRHMQWAHFAGGGTGGGLRWPYRHPHRLTDGMHDAQHRLSRFAATVDWPRFARRPLAERIEIDRTDLLSFGCGSADQVLLWLLRGDITGRDGMLRPDAGDIRPSLRLRGLRPGPYRTTLLRTRCGRKAHEDGVVGPDGLLELSPVLSHDVVLLTKRL